MWRRIVVVVGCGVCLSAGPAWAQFGASLVVDLTNLPQNIIAAVNSVSIAANTAASYVRQGEQLINEYNMIRNQISQYETMVKNLQRLPQGLNMVDTVLAYGNKLTGLLNSTNSLSYTLDDATKQFHELYEEAGTVASGDLRLVRERFLKARMGASSTAVQVQSIRANMSDIFNRLCALLDGSWTAEGNLDAQQIAHQQQALTLTTLQQIQALQMTADRLKAQREAEEVALARLKERVQAEFLKPLPEYTAEQGTLPTWSWTTTTD